MKVFKIFVIIGVAILIVSCFGKKLAKKSGLGCKVCIYGDKSAKHTGLCTVFIKDKPIDKDTCEAVIEDCTEKDASK